MGASQRSKGARGEREWAAFLREHGYASAHRGRQYSGGPDSPDIKCVELEEFSFEVKRVERLNIHKAMSQAIGDAVRHAVPIIGSNFKLKLEQS